MHALAASFARFAMLRQVNFWRSLLEVDEEDCVRASGLVMCQDHKAIRLLAQITPTTSLRALSLRHEMPLTGCT